MLPSNPTAKIASSGRLDNRGQQVRDDVRSLASFKMLNLMQDFSSLGS